MISEATRHYRGMFERRSPEILRTLSHIKRFMERVVGDQDFRNALAECADDPQPLAHRYGIDIDPKQMAPLWLGTHFKYRYKPECSQWPLAVLWDEYIGEMLKHRDMLRDEGDMSVSNPRFDAWRKRQIQRCLSELGVSAGSVTHPVIAFELSEGCTVGCWFCGLSADRYKGHFAYSEENARLWRGVVEAAHAVFGSAARTGFCYWATDPCDNPDYDRFLLDYYQITGALPQTTTAAPLKNEALTRRVLALFDEYRTVTNRFSVLTRKQLDKIHQTFTPEELMGVELVMQSKESLTAKADAGRARERRAKLREADKSDRIALIELDHSTIACVSGFLISMPLRRIQLVTPVPGSERWPLGYRIVAERFFDTVDAFRVGVENIIDEHMTPDLPADKPIRFRGDLTYEAGEGYFSLKSRSREYTIQDNAASVSVGALIARGMDSVEQLMAIAAESSEEIFTIAYLIEQLYEAGLLEEDLDDSYIGRRNEGLDMRKRTKPRQVAREAGVRRTQLDA